ncbi:hypothetical protein [Microbacterium paludicola]|uniref:hypothetical protein n=1 Tax=Microbacterium paludicola TaxID=300019 RepID=UPI0011A2F484|nr:hypothetical protein [Microbacterium paludicola]
MTLLMALLTYAYFVMALFGLTTPIPFEAFFWGGLILIFGWWAHDAIHERKGAREDAHRNSQFV